MNAPLKIFVLSTLALFLVACASAPSYSITDKGLGLAENRVPAKDVSRVTVGSVNFYSVTVFLYAEQTPQNYFSFTLDRANVREGYSSKDVYDFNRKKAIDANWNGRFYSESSHYPTYAHFNIKSLTQEEAVVEVSARLVHPETGEFIQLSQATTCAASATATPKSS